MSDDYPQTETNPGVTVYQIRVQGRLDERWSAWFNGLTVRLECEEPLITSLTGPIVDQAGLRGVLTHIFNLNLSLISVNRLDAGSLLPQSPASQEAEGR